MSTTQSNAPDFECEAYERQLDDLIFVRDLQAGRRRLVERKDVYLRRHKAEEWDDFEDRAARSYVFPAFTRSVRGLTGMVFRQGITLEDVPAKMEPHLEVIDGQQHLEVIAREVFEDALVAGHSFILVDAPKRPKGNLTLKDEQALNLRPYWVHVKKDNVLSWRVHRTPLADELQQVVIRERTLEPDGEFGEKAVTRYREFAVRNGKVRWRLFERENDLFNIVGNGIIANVTEIPLVPIYTNKTDFFTSIPPLLELAQLNVAHFRVQADHLTALHKASVPILTISGIKPQSAPLEVGPNTCLSLPEGASASYTEHSGPALRATRQQLLDLQTQMAVAGLTMLQHETRAAETAEAKKIDKSEQDSSLAVAARSLEDGLENALKLHAQMMRQPDTVSATVNRDFDNLRLDERELREYAALVSNGLISRETLWRVMARGGALPDDFDPELERAQIEGDFI